MVVSNRDRVGRTFDFLTTGLQRYVEREIRRVYASQWLVEASDAGRRQLQPGADNKSATNWDAKSLLDCIWARWNEVFGQKLGPTERSAVGMLREARNQWAHNEPFEMLNTSIVLDNATLLLTAVGAPEQAQEVDRQRQELLRARFEEQEKRVTRRAASAPTEGQPRVGLTPWREIIAPHPDVASGRYQQAEFAADLGQVHRGEASDEYQRPRDFFRRTYLTEGLKHLLVDALRRLDGSGGDPVVKLQTNFGGGKTHAMLALYHLVSDVSLDDLPGLEPVLAEAGVAAPPAAQQVVIVGTALSPGQAHRRPDGTVVHTMWGELAWQLLGADGYALVAEADRAGVSPGSDVLREILAASAPCLILVDEWVAYLRQLVDVKGLPAGSFDANYSFAQSLTEAVRAVPRTLLVATLPESDIEIGGEAGRQALTRLENVFSRVEAVWRPASAVESFEIVRRRLFEPIADPALFPARDAVVRAFGELYRGQAQEFPSDCGEGSYERRIEAAYPIHPELFDRLYEDWSSLERFQRTRGVLRLMAKVIHALWESDDRNLLIMPGTVPVGDAEVLSELTRYLEDNWVPVIEKDVDGPASLPLELDRENHNLGRYSACRRVARALYLGSAPTLRAANRGIEDRQLKLGCVQPGETVATFGDALRRLTEQATYLYVDGHRYWYSTQPSVTRLAQDRAAQQSEEQVDAEVERRLRLQLTKRGDFARVHVAPTSSADVPDEADARLVVLGPGRVHVPRAEDSPALAAARQILDNRGNAPRIYRNALVFLAADDRRVPALREAVRSYLAWRSIQEQQEELNLDAFQRRQAETRSKSADETVENQIPEAWVSLLVPAQPDPRGAVEWDESRVSGAEPLAVRAGKKLAVEGKLAVQYGGRTLRAELDRIPLWQGDSVGVGQLMDWYGQYLYLQRLASPEVLLGAIAEGAGAMLTETEGFAYADGIDATSGRFTGLTLRQRPSRVLSTGLVVRAEAALRQQAEEQREREARQTVYPSGSGQSNGEVSNGHGTYDTGGGTAVVEPERPKTPKYRRFHGTVELPTMKVPSTAGQIAQEVIAHLEGLVGARVRITLEIEADVPNGVPDDVVRTVTENARTLKFGPGSGFEEE